MPISNISGPSSDITYQNTIDLSNVTGVIGPANGGVGTPGVNGTQIIANSTDTGGFNWYENGVRPALQSGRFLSPFNAAALSTANAGAGVIIAAPVYVEKRTSFQAMGFSISAAATTLNVKLAVYTDVAGVPTSLVAGSTVTGGPYTVVTDTAETIAFGVAVVLNPGWYWLTIQADQTQAVKGMNTGQSPITLGTTDMLAIGARWQATATFAAGPPSTFGTTPTIAASNAPYLGLQVS